jgi:hypothetical protein
LQLLPKKNRKRKIKKKKKREKAGGTVPAHGQKKPTAQLLVFPNRYRPPLFIADVRARDVSTNTFFLL